MDADLNSLEILKEFITGFGYILNVGVSSSILLAITFLARRLHGCLVNTLKTPYVELK